MCGCASAGTPRPVSLTVMRYRFSLTCNCHHASAGRVLDCVVHKVQEKTTQQVFIAAKRHLFSGLDLQGQTLFGAERADGAGNFAGKFVQIEFLRRELVLAGVGAREHEEVFDDSS
jgi:hypothetical protein